MWLIGIFLLQLIGSSSSFDISNAKGIIQNSIKRQVDEKSADSIVCKISESEECSISNMKRDVSYVVQPGGETRCIYSTSSPYGIQVIPGDSDKLMIFFQGGGACWDQLSVASGLCSTNANPLSFSGLSKRADDRNIFSSYTVINLLYCSGDIWIGNVTQTFKDPSGQPVIQKGLNNVRSSLDWLHKQSFFPQQLTNLVIAGASAGAIGAQFWANQILSEFNWIHATAIIDSYVGVFPEGTDGPLIKKYGTCTSDVLTPGLQASCNDETLSLAEVNLALMPLHPNVPYAFVQSKVDSIQQAFYQMVATTSGVSDIINPTKFYSLVNDIFSTYASQLPNFIVYLVNGPQHCYTDSDAMYSADPQSASDNGQSSDALMLHEWLNQYPLISGQVDSICEGDTSPHSKTDNTYCDNRVYPHSYYQK